MKHVLRFLPEVEDDVVAGYEWYEERSRGLGEEFLGIFYSSVSEILRHPLSSQEINRGFRRKLLRRFPYAIYYKIENNEIVVSGFLHCARDPAKIRRSLRERSD